MADENQTPSGKSSRYLLWLALAALIVVGLVFFVSHGGVDKALVKQQLDQFAFDLRQHARASGRDVELTYGGIEMTGGFTDRHAIVQNPRLLIKPLPENTPPPVPGKSNSLLITSPVLEIYPESAALSAMKLELPQPVDVTSEEEPNKSLLKVTSNAPWTLFAEQSTTNGVDYMRLQQTLPGVIRLTYLKEQVAQGVEDKTPMIVPVYETLVVTLDKGEGDLRYALDGSDLGEGRLTFRNLAIAPDKMPDMAVKIGKIDGHWENVLGSDKLNRASSSATIDSITAPAEIIPYAPISFTYELSYSGALPSAASKLAGGQQSVLKLKTLSLHTKDSTLDADADFTSTTEEMLPAGTAHLKITNVPFLIGELKKHAIFSPESELLFEQVVEHVSGQHYADVKDLAIEVKRAKGGVFQIGHATFEDLFALFIRNKLQRLQTQTIPPAAAPAVKPQPAKPVAPHGDSK